MSRLAIFKFRLYIAGNTENSCQALANLKALCAKVLSGRHEIEIVDVFKHPKRALDDGIFLTPTLLKFNPNPSRKIVGTLSNSAPLLHALGLEDDKAA